MKRIQTKTRKLAAVLALAGMSGFLTAGSAKATSAYLSSREAVENNAGIADNRIAIEEPDFDPDTKTDYGTTIFPKRVNLTNTGNTPVYARVRLVFSDPQAEACTSFVNSKGTFPAMELSSHLPDGWVNGIETGLGDYYYCTEPLAPGSTAPDLISSAVTTFGPDQDRLDYDIYVRAESIQIKRNISGSSEQSEQSWSDAWKTHAF